MVGLDGGVEDVGCAQGSSKGMKLTSLTRRSFVLKFIFLGTVYVALIAAAVSAPLGVSTGWSVGALLTAQASLALFLIPSAFCFMVSAILFRERWATLTAPQIMAAGAFSFLVTLMLGLGLSVVFAPLQHYSQALVRPTNFMMMILPGSVAGQLLRFGPSQLRQSSETR